MRSPKLTVFASVLVFSACSSERGTSPTAPSGGTPPSTQPQVQQYGGVWQGEYRLTACSGERHCGLIIGNMRPFLLRLEQTGAAVAGVLAGDVTVDVAGIVAPTGELSLSGTYAAVSALDTSGEVELRRFELRRSGDGLTGTLDYAVAYSPGVLFGEFSLKTSRSGEITRAVRMSQAMVTHGITSFDGSWRGRFVVRECVPVRWRDCWPQEKLHTYDTSVALQQSGPAITGTMRIGPYTVPLTGTASGASVELTGQLTSIVSGGRVVLQVTRWSASRDTVGRLRGTFSYEDTYVQDAGDPLSTGYEAELVSMVLQP